MGGIRNTARKVGGAIKRGAKKVGKTLYKHKGKIAAAAGAGLMALGAYENHVNQKTSERKPKPMSDLERREREAMRQDNISHNAKMAELARAPRRKDARIAAKNAQPRKEDAAWMNKMMHG